LDSRLARHHDGSGLGLVLVYRMTELHGGSVGADSTLGVGSRFTISLPWREPAMPAFIHSADEAEALLNRLRRVLLIDSSPTTIEQVRRYLLELGAETIVLPPQVDAVEAARRERPDLIIMDVFFADQSGPAILAKLRQYPETRAIPVLVLSVVADSLMPEMSADGSGQRIYHLLKPISRQQLSQALVKTALQLVNPVEPAVSPIQLPATVNGCQPLVLIVEDNETNIRTLVDYLSAKQYQLEIARGGPDAIALVRQSQPDLVLMDIQMPNMDGIEVIRVIRAELGLTTLPIIALTALAMPGDREKTLAAGANDYLSKPVSLKRLVALVEQYVRE
jgi:CheY-like chemotaxis protein